MIILTVTNIVIIIATIFLFKKIVGYRRSQLTLRRLFGHINIGYYSFRCTDGLVLAANRGFVNILELDVLPKEVEGKTVGELFIDIDNDLDLIEKIRSRGELKNYEFWVKTLKGNSKCILYNAYIIKDTLTGHDIVEALFEDITEERVSYEKMKESEERYETLFKNAGDMVIIYNMENMIMEEVNPVTEIISGYSAEDLVGKTFDMMFHPKRRNVLKEAQHDLIFRGSARLETAMVTKSGIYKEVILTLSIANIKEEKIVMALVKDISEIVEEREEQKRRKKELEKFWQASIEREERIKDLRKELERVNRQRKISKEKHEKKSFK